MEILARFTFSVIASGVYKNFMIKIYDLGEWPSGFLFIYLFICFSHVNPQMQ